MRTRPEEAELESQYLQQHFAKNFIDNYTNVNFRLDIKARFDRGQSGGTFSSGTYYNTISVGSTSKTAQVTVSSSG